MMSSNKEKNYYGEKNCSIIYNNKNGVMVSCKNKSYFEHSETGELLCGVHSKKYKKMVKDLKKRDKGDAQRILLEKYRDEDTLIESFRVENETNGKKGTVVLSRLQMMHAPDDIAGYRKVFPNFKHGPRKDGLGMPSLSPMSLGPVEHGQPVVPVSLNIENFHQGSKCFQKDLESDGKTVGKTYEESRNKMFQDSEPHRHKYKDGKGKPLLPLFFVWIDSKSKQHYLNALQCRQFYCNFYERLVSQQDDFKKLQQLKNSGVNLQIIGYDARPVKPDDILLEYQNTKLPFGHELVLATMLWFDDPQQYPWRKFKTFDF
ncbi:hypothetical protein DLAC_02314 [Tieghemostelium lacteum]|uniref:Uncharacterized protein n=1 Tax=Tieghemostelium lacteum TaxID=361077 RepID=A0A152A541_TIELA|nr:hypothetical protein DLAC_02314 [Tieghemostelium lacteum]|eukprot:KYR01197.1 hypothetical protein DLAC_02314 [Tieghemostelium lacteum]